VAPPTINVKALTRYLRKRGSPLAGSVPAIVKYSTRHGVDPRFVIAVAGQETRFGKVGNATAMNNAWGWGPGKSFKNWGAAVNTLAKGLADPNFVYAGQGNDTISEIAGKWAPIGAGNDPTGLNQHWTKGVSQFYKELGGNPSAPVIGGNWRNAQAVNTPPQPGPQNPAAADGPSFKTVSQPGMTFAEPMDWNLLANTHGQNLSDIMAGKIPDQTRLNQLMTAVQRAVPVQLPSTDVDIQIPGMTPQDTTGRNADRGQPGARGVLGPPKGGNYGFPSGGPDSGKVATGGHGGNWGGSMPRALQIAKLVGNTPTSQKRTKRNTASGNPSDHWVGLKSSYAIDLPYSSNSEGDEDFRAIVKALGKPNLKPGQWHNIPYNGYRYQVGWETGGHWDHIHVGVRPVTPSTR